MAAMIEIASTPEPAEKALARQAASWPDRARALRVVDQPTYEQASEHLIGIKGLRASIEETFGPIIAKAHAAHKEAVAQRKKVEAPLEEAECILKKGISGYLAEQERLRREEERRLREAVELQAAAELEQRIEEAERSGAPVAEINAMIEQPLVVPAPVAPPRVQRVEGISMRETWRAEVVDKAALIRAAAVRPDLHALLEVNVPALNGMARALKSAMSIPGVRAVCETGVSVRRA